MKNEYNRTPLFVRYGPSENQVEICEETLRETLEEEIDLADNNAVEFVMNGINPVRQFKQYRN